MAKDIPFLEILEKEVMETEAHLGSCPFSFGRR